MIKLRMFWLVESSNQSCLSRFLVWRKRTKGLGEILDGKKERELIKLVIVRINWSFGIKIIINRALIYISLMIYYFLIKISKFIKNKNLLKNEFL